jgi:uncharacterized protein (TIGR02145 family)
MRYLLGLKGGTEYHVRVFATNADGIEYGNDVSFTTEPADTPRLTTTVPSNITSITATSGGTIISDNGASISASGVCWGTSPNPTIANSKSAETIKTGEFISPVTGLIPLTTYYLRAYTTSDLGTNYGEELSFTTSSVLTAITDVDGNSYTSVTIGNQVWMQQNLKTTRYSNGDLIGTTSPASMDISNESIPKYQWAYDGNESNAFLYGRLYTWFVVNDSRNVCPAGWHVPTNAEWIALTDYLISNGYGEGGSRYKIAKSMTYFYGWFPDWAGAINVDLTGYNSSGFSALPGGTRTNTSFSQSGKASYWWSSSEESSTLAWIGCSLSYGSGFTESGSLKKENGFSVRCLKN